MKHLESPASGLRVWTLWALTVRKDHSLEVAGAQVGTSQVQCDWEGQKKKKKKTQPETEHSESSKLDMHMMGALVQILLFQIMNG